MSFNPLLPDEEKADPLCEVLFLPSGRGGLFPLGMTLLEAARRAGVWVESLCGGEGWCGQCVVQVHEGSFGAAGKFSSFSHLSPPQLEEVEELTARHMPPGSRLACFARLKGDVCVEIVGRPPSEKSFSDKTLHPTPFEVDPLIRLCWLRLEASGQSAPSLLEAVQHQLARQFGLGALEWETEALRSLAEAGNLPPSEVTLTVWDDRRVVRVQPGFQQRALGLAVDIGTTTLAVYLCDLRRGDLLATAASLNPQAGWGADVISRIAFCAQHPDGLTQLSAAVRAEINRLAEQTARSAGVELADVMDSVWVGNSVMLHLALGVSPQSLGQAPFQPVFRDALDLSAAQAGLNLNPAARLYLLPLIAGYVGADAVAAVLAADLHRCDEMTLLVDAGTNGELILGNRHGLVCTSSPTGPAFEGGNITFGMRAAPGAIERVRIDPKTRKVRFKVIGELGWSDEQPAFPPVAAGICGSGILEAVAEMYATGLLLPNGRFNPQVSSPGWLRNQKGELVFVLAGPTETTSGEPIYLTQKDIRAVQLAKAALRSGCDFLLKAQGIPQPERILLAGAFGSLLDARHAIQIGLIPPIPLEKVQAIGNAAGEGACRVLLSRTKRQEAMQIARQTRHLVMPADPSFQDQFTAALAFPPILV